MSGMQAATWTPNTQKQSIEDCFAPGESERHASRDVDTAPLIQRLTKLIVFLLPGRNIQG